MIGRASCLLGSPPIALPLPPTEGRLIPARSRLRFYVNGLSAHVGRRDWLDWVRRGANTGRGHIWLPCRVEWHTATPSTRESCRHIPYMGHAVRDHSFCLHAPVSSNAGKPTHRFIKPAVHLRSIRCPAHFFRYRWGDHVHRHDGDTSLSFPNDQGEYGVGLFTTKYYRLAS